MSLKYILGKPDTINSAGDVFPVKVKEYEEFVDYSLVLYCSKDHFGEGCEEYKLLDLIVFTMRDPQIIQSLELLFALTMKKKFTFFINDETQRYGFHSNDLSLINRDNYDEIRSSIMRQNLMFEEKVFKNKLVQEWANKVIQARAKNAVKMEFEDILSTVSVFTGKHYWDLEEYTIYQLKSDFNRINKIKEYDSNIAFKCAGADNVTLDYYAETLDMFKNPYDDIFKSKDKSKLEQSLK